MSDLSPAIVAAVISVAFTALINLLGAVYVHGKSQQRLDGVDSKVLSLETDQDRQWSKIGEHGERIAWVEAKVNGKAAR